jgi:hypothetical protein
LTRFAFVDAVIAAEVLQVTRDTVLDWVSSGRLRTFGGKPDNPFFRSADIAQLAEEIGVRADEQPRRIKSASAKVQQRLTADSRWSDITTDEIKEWVRRTDSSRRQAARVAAATAIQRLEVVLFELDETADG